MIATPPAVLNRSATPVAAVATASGAAIATAAVVTPVIVPGVTASAAPARVPASRERAPWEREATGPASLAAVMVEVEAEVASGAVDRLRPVPTGYTPLDDVINGGLRPGDLLVDRRRGWRRQDDLEPASGAQRRLCRPPGHRDLHLL